MPSALFHSARHFQEKALKQIHILAQIIALHSIIESLEQPLSNAFPMGL
jgi:hypothetical protein